LVLDDETQRATVLTTEVNARRDTQIRAGIRLGATAIASLVLAGEPEHLEPAAYEWASSKRAASAALSSRPTRRRFE